MSEERTPNIPLLRKVVEWVEEQEGRTEGREWYQGDWIALAEELREEEEELGGEGWCDTVFCVAGKVALDAGWKPAEEWGRVTRRGQIRPVDEVAEELLGLSKSHPLFFSGNTASDIRHIAESIAGEPL